MSYQLGSITSAIHRTTGLIQGSAANYSCFFWFRPDTDINIGKGNNVYSRIDAGSTAWTGIFGGSTDQYSLDISNGIIDLNTTIKTLVAGHWYPIGYEKIGNSHIFYVSTLANGSVSVDISSVVFTDLILGYDGFATTEANGTFAYFREWTASLSSTDFVREANSRIAVKTANLVTDCPLTSDLLDLTANHNDFIAIGAGSFLSDDPIPVGCIVSEAIDMGTLPYSITVDAKPTDVEFIFDKWYKYTSAAPEVYIGGWFVGNLSTYKINYAVYSDAGITGYPVEIPIEAQDVRFQMPVTNGHTYYFYAGAQFTNLSFSTLTIDFLTAPNENAPDGSYLINDDQAPFYSAILSAIPNDDYHVLKFRQFVNTLSDWAGDYSELNYNILVSDDASAKMKLYNFQLALLTDTGLATSGTTKVRRIPNGSAYYVGELLAVNRVSNTGIVGTTINLVGTKISALAANNDETVLYVAVLNAANAPVKRWDLVNSVYLSDLTAGISTYLVTDMMVLTDDSILVLHIRNGFSVIVHRYDSTGVLLNTYDQGVGSTVSLAYDYTDPDNYFLIRIQDISVSGVSTIQRIKLSDGTFTQTNYVRFEDGIYSPNPTLTPIAKFGHSISCPFFPIRAFTERGGIYKLVPGKRNDTLWLDIGAQTTEDVKIPDPFIETAAIGN